jgi:hypothetical protein
MHACMHCAPRTACSQLPWSDQFDLVPIEIIPERLRKNDLCIVRRTSSGLRTRPYTTAFKIHYICNPVQPVQIQILT